MKKYLIVILIVLLSGCVSTKSSNSSTNEEQAYIAGYFTKFTHKIVFKNLETGKNITLKFKKSKNLTVVAIPPGIYAPTSISGNGFNKKYKVDLPLYLMTKIEIRPSTVTFLGDFKYTQSLLQIINPLVDGSTNIQYPFERFEDDILIMFNNEIMAERLHYLPN